MNPQETIRQALIEELGIEGLPPQAQQEAIATAGGPILQSVMLDILEKIPQPNQSTFQAALEAGDQNRIEALINENIPDSDVLIEQSVAKAIAEFKTLRSS
jgi:hypothetical protein